MAVSSQVLDPNIITAADNDAATIVSKNVIAEEYIVAPYWSTSSNMTGTDVTLPSKPTERAIDGRLDLGFAMGQDAAPVYYYVYCSFNASTVDFCALYLSDVNQGTWNIEVQVSNSLAFPGTNNDTVAVASWSNVNTEGRLVQDRLVDTAVFPGTVRQFTGLQYARIRFQEIGTSTNTPPEVGEWTLGQQRQLSRSFDGPWDDEPYGSEYIKSVSWNRRQSKYSKSEGFQDHEATYGFSARQLDAYGFDDHATLKLVRSECGAGLKPCWFRAKTGADWLFGCFDSDWKFPINNYDDREWDFKFTEDPPFAVNG